MRGAIKPTLKTTELELTVKDQAGMLKYDEFIERYFGENYDGSIVGRHFWFSSVVISNKASLERNQLPIETIVSRDVTGGPSFHKISPTGDPLDEIVKIGNLSPAENICETELQARYMYNKDLEVILSELDERERGLDKIRSRIIGLELDTGHLNI